MVQRSRFCMSRVKGQLGVLVVVGGAVGCSYLLCVPAALWPVGGVGRPAGKTERRRGEAEIGRAHV